MQQLGALPKKLLENGFLSGIVIVSFWLLSTWPGYMNPDSALHWEEALTGRYPNWHPSTYSLLVKLSQLVVSNSVVPLVVFQAVIILSSICFLVTTVAKSAIAQNLVVVATLVWPQTGFMLSLVGKDGLFAAAFMVILGSVIRAIQRGSISRSGTALLFASTLALTVLRWNGPLAVIWILACIIVLRPQIARKLTLILLCALLLGTFWLINPLPSDNSGARDLRRGGKALDIAWSIRTDRKSFNTQDLVILNQIAPLEAWSNSQANCDNFNLPLLYDVFAENESYARALSASEKDVDRIWRNRIVRHPLNFVSGRLCKVKGFVIPAREWWPTYESTSQETMKKFFGNDAVPILDQGLLDRTGSLFNSWGGSSLGLALSMPIVWYCICGVLLLVVRSERRRARTYLAMSIAVPISVFISGVGVEPRYLWPATLTVAILTFALASNFILDAITNPIRSRKTHSQST
jgi:hypothetical protein